MLALTDSQLEIVISALRALRSEKDVLFPDTQANGPLYSSHCVSRWTPHFFVQLDPLSPLLTVDRARDTCTQAHGGDRRSEDFKWTVQEKDGPLEADFKLYNNEDDVQLENPPTGNSRAAFLRRLRKDRPDIHTRVLAGELSPHAGMIEAA